MRKLPRSGHRRPRIDRRRGNRRGLAQRRRRCPRTARTRRIRPRARPLQDLHPRRGPHGHAARLQRAAENRGGAAGACHVHLRHHRAGQGDRHHPLSHPPLSVSPRAAGDHGAVSGTGLRQREHRSGTGRAASGHALRRRLRAGHAFRARPVDGRCRGRRDLLRFRGRIAGLHPGRAHWGGRRRRRRQKRRSAVRGDSESRGRRIRSPPIRGGPAVPRARPAGAHAGRGARRKRAFRRCRGRKHGRSAPTGILAGIGRAHFHGRYDQCHARQYERRHLASHAIGTSRGPPAGRT